MKKTLVVCLMLLLLNGLSGAAIRLGLSGGYAKHLESNFGGGPAAGFSLGFDLISMFAVEARGLWFASDVAGSTTKLSKGQMTVMPVELALVARFNAGIKLIPYFAIGGGYGLNSFKVDSTVVSAWSKMGMTLAESLKGGLTILVGAGFDYILKPGPKPGQGLFLNLEARYLMGKADGTWSLTDTASKEKATGTLGGLKLDSIMIGLGLKYGF
ncbi:MAG: hypothetical protein NTU60_08640 [Candidatus Aminicenantes bacterium]|nr:hypothetical protein [Candidatus Aminicenantes bacterium]